jgi:tRNA threonylcarbamoyladenosine biosynthesis protein TsaB
MKGFISIQFDIGLHHTEHIMGMVEYVLSQAQLEPKNLDLLACSGGPGSFTGLRIGLSTIKGLAFGLQKPFVTVSSLYAIAHDVFGASQIVVPVIDAKRSSFYFAVYNNGILESGPFDAGIDKMLKITEPYSELLIAGQDADMLEGIERPGIRIISESRRSPVISLIKLAMIQYRQVGPSDPDTGLEYIRLSDAESRSAGSSVQNCIKEISS